MSTSKIRSVVYSIVYWVLGHWVLGFYALDTTPPHWNWNERPNIRRL